jgi:hypothetical protein
MASRQGLQVMVGILGGQTTGGNWIIIEPLVSSSKDKRTQE